MKQYLTLKNTLYFGGGLFVLFMGWFIYIYLQIRFEIDEVINYKPKVSTQFFDRNGDLVANIFEEEHRVYVPYKEIPARVIESLLAIEDTNFFEHDGTNFEAIMRAIIKNIKAGRFAEGASTITQQLVKTMLLTREKKLSRKAKEMFLTYQVEASLSKEEILERYFNEVYFGHNYYGIRTASLGYFNKELKDLTLKEIGMLVALPRAPSYYDPTRNLKFSLSRANHVMSRLYDLGWISENEFQQATNETPMVYNNTLTKNKAPYVVDEAIKILQKNYPDIKSGGYKVNLTIDLKTQKIADEALINGYKTIAARDTRTTKDERNKQLNGAIVVLENGTGKILALTGGVDYRTSSFNRATQSIRQPGSSVKPFIFEIGLENGMSPESTVEDVEKVYTFKDASGNLKEWRPQNYKKEFKGAVTLRSALTHSMNLATISLVEKVGIATVHSRLQEFGFRNIPYNLSIVLGSFGISPIEMSKLFTMFSNQGMMHEPTLLASIVDKDGKLTHFTQSTPKSVITPENAYDVTSMMQDVVTRGTGSTAHIPELALAGKTGTTNNNVDVWFCGFSPEVQAVIWYGNDDNKPMAGAETGGRTAAPVFGQFMRSYLATYPNTKRGFTIPSSYQKSKDLNMSLFESNTSDKKE